LTGKIAKKKYDREDWFDDTVAPRAAKAIQTAMRGKQAPNAVKNLQTAAADGAASAFVETITKNKRGRPLGGRN
jgi:hypothetical protein